MPPPSSSSAAAAPVKRPLPARSAKSHPQLPKRTRDLPNLSQCHACNLRITNCGKDRLHTLDSFWRIVILCSKCFDRMNSSDLCSYCLSQLGECFTFGCCNCKRRVHQDCVAKYKGSAPWSYCPCLESVCLDCWLPNSMPNSGSRRNSGRDSNGKTPVKIRSDMVVAEGSDKILDRVSGTENLEDVVRDVNSGVEKKVVAAARAKDKALKKAVLARSAVELATGALNLVASKDENGGKEGSVAPVVDDEELAFRLHRAINSSPRISKNFCLVNSVYVTIPKADCNDDSSGKEESVCGKSDPDRTLSEPSVHGKSSSRWDWFIPESKQCQENEIVRMGSAEIGGIVDKYDVEDEKVELPLKEGEGSCSNRLVNSGADDNSMDWESQPCQKQNQLGLLDLQPAETKCGFNYGMDTMLQDKRFVEKPDRYLKKYTKRHISSKAVKKCLTKFHCEGYLETRASAPGLPLNCLKASETFYDASLRSCGVPVQASVFARGSS